MERRKRLQEGLSSPRLTVRRFEAEKASQRTSNAGNGSSEARYYGIGKVLDEGTEFLHSMGYLYDLTLVESKDISSREKNPYREMLIRLSSVSSEQKKLYFSRMSDLKKAYGKSLSSSVSKGKISDIRSVVSKAFQAAYKLGFYSSGQSKDFKFAAVDSKFLQKAADTEISFALRFEKSKSKLSQKQFSRRVQMYEQTLDSMFTAGWLSNFPSDTKVWWVLNAKESCPDCIKLASNSPYSLGEKNPLPTTPRSGSTKCISFCRCTLRVVLPGTKEEEDEESPLLNQSSIITDSSDPVAKEIDAKYSQMNAIRQRIQLEKDPDLKKDLMSQRREINDEIIDLSEKKKIKFVPRYSSKDVEKAVSGYKSQDLLDPTSVKKGDSLALVQNVYSFPATVKSSSRKGVNFTTVYGDIFLSVDRFPEILLFKK